MWFSCSSTVIPDGNTFIMSLCTIPTFILFFAQTDGLSVDLSLTRTPQSAGSTETAMLVYSPPTTHTHTQGATFISHTLMSYWPHSTLEGRSHTFMQCFILTAAIMSGATVAHLCSSVSDTHAIFHFIAGCTVVGSLRRSLIISITLLGSLSAAGASKHRASLHWSSEILFNTLPWPHDLLHQGHREVEQEVLDYSAIALIFPSL